MGSLTAPRCFHKPSDKNSASNVKKVPVTCSHRTPENRASGDHTDRPNVCAFVLVVATLRCVSTTRSTTREICGWAVTRLGTRDGLGALAASAAFSSDFAACRAPYPKARPKRTLSIVQPVYCHAATSFLVRQLLLKCTDETPIHTSASKEARAREGYFKIRKKYEKAGLVS